MKASYGDVTAEYRTMLEGAARVEGAHDLVWVEGPDAVRFLQDIVSQEVATAPVGSVRRSLLLSPQGKLEALLWLLRGEERVGVVTDTGWGDHVAERLNYFRIRVKAEIRPEPRPLWELWGADAAAVSGLSNPDRWEEIDGTLLAPLPLASTGRVLVAGDLAVEAPPAGQLAVTALRVEAGEPVMGRDVDESTIPHASGLVPEAVSFAKGCFLGYELVERIESRGRQAPKRLLGVAITRNLLPPEGAEVYAGDKQVGTIASVSESLRVGAPVGLGLLHRDVSPGDELTIRFEGGETPAVARELPMV